MVPELDVQHDAPPLVGGASEPFPQGPDADQHNQGVAIMQYFHLDRPGINHAKHPECLGTWPAHNVDLVGLEEMLSPMTQHNHHENLKGRLVPLGVELFVKAGVISGY